MFDDTTNNSNKSPLTEFTNNIVKIAIVQGNYQSAVSIKNIVPLEDYAAIVSPIITPPCEIQRTISVIILCSISIFSCDEYILV